MKRLIALMSAMLMSFAFVAVAGSSATAAPTTHTTTMHSPLLQLGNALGLFQITTFGGTTFDAASGKLTAQVVGNPERSQLVIQSGGLTLTKGDGTSLTIRNLHHDMKNGVVTGVIADERVALYDAVQTSDTTATLLVHPEGGAILRAFVNFLGLPADGSAFGTLTLN